VFISTREECIFCALAKDSADEATKQLREREKYHHQYQLAQKQQNNHNLSDITMNKSPSYGS
jgi:hypothetical protein